MKWLEIIKNLLKKKVMISSVISNALKSLSGKLKKAWEQLAEKIRKALQESWGKLKKAWEQLAEKIRKALQESWSKKKAIANSNMLFSSLGKIMQIIVKIDNKLHQMVSAKIIRLLSLNVAFLQLTIAFLVLISFNYLVNDIKIAFMYSAESIISYNLGYDSVSIIFIILTALIYILCILLNWNLKYKLKQCLLCLFIINILLVQAFLSMDLFMFYIFFESVLIPMFLLIGIFGSRSRKTQAAYKFFLYTLFGSLFMLIAILNLYHVFGSCDRALLQNMDLSDMRQIVLCAAFLVGLAVKIPMFPFHLWLPEAHVEASTSGSVMLAGILLKLGTYAIVRFVIPIFPSGFAFWAPWGFVFSLLGILYASLVCLRQVDLKKIVAYSSIAHMNVVTLGLFALNFQSVEGSLFLMVSHGIISAGLFICVGMLYDRYKTRVLLYYSGLAELMPVFSVVFFIFILANMSIPGSSNFVGEMLIILGSFQGNTFAAIVASLTVILSAAYSLWFFNRIVFTKLKQVLVFNYCDITKREYFIVFPLLLSNFLIGFCSPLISVTWYNFILNITWC